MQSKELQDIINGKGDVEDDAEDIIIQIERTTQLVDNYEAKTSKLRDDTARILREDGSQSEKKRKLKPVLLEVKANDKMVKQLKFSLEKQRTELAKVNGQVLYYDRIPGLTSGKGVPVRSKWLNVIKN